MLVLIFDKDARRLWRAVPEKAEFTPSPEAQNPEDGHKNSDENADKSRPGGKNVESKVFALLLLGAGFVADGWYRLEVSQVYQLGVISSILLMACLRFMQAADSFDEALAKAVYQDFIVLSSGKGTPAESAAAGTK